MISFVHSAQTEGIQDLMNEPPFGSSEIAVLLNDFLLNDDIAGLAADVGRLLGYPLQIGRASCRERV